MLTCEMFFNIQKKILSFPISAGPCDILHIDE